MIWTESSNEKRNLLKGWQSVLAELFLSDHVRDLDGKETIALSQDGIEALLEIIEDQYPQIAKQSQDNSPK